MTHLGEEGPWKGSSQEGLVHNPTVGPASLSGPFSAPYPQEALCNRGTEHSLLRARPAANPAPTCRLCPPCMQTLSSSPVPPASRARCCEARALPSNAARGSWKRRTVRAGRIGDLRPRNCLALLALHKGGEYPRERSAHAFPLQLEIGHSVHWQIFFFSFSYFFFRFFPFFFFFPLLVLFMLLNALPARSGPR